MIRWIPALLDPQVKAQFNHLCHLCPAQLVSFQKQDTPLPSCQQTLSACSLLLMAYLQVHQHTSITNIKSHPIIGLFFNGVPQQFDEFETKEIPRTIHLWLSRLFLNDSSHQIHLLIKEDNEHFSLNIQVSLSQESPEQLTLTRFFAQPDHTQEKLQVLADLALLCEYLPEIEALIDDPEHATLTFHYAKFSSIFMHILPVLQTLGIGVVLPKSLQKLARLQLRLDLHSEEGLDDKQAFLKLDELLRFDWKIAIGDKSVDIDQFKQMLQQSSGIVRMLDQYVLLDDAELKRMLKQLDTLPNTLNNAQLLQAALGEEYHDAQVAAH